MMIRVEMGSNTATALEPIDLVAEGVWERKQLQQWILANPSALGEDLLVLDEEFDQFQGSFDRLDILCLDSDGSPVIVELKRDRHAGHADLQALRYAAKVKGLDLSTAARVLSDFRSRKGEPMTEEQAAEEILRFLDSEGDEDAELLPDPRLILASPGFSKDVSTTVLFLREHGLDISCIELRAYRTDPDHLALVPDRLIPLPEADEYMAKLELREAKQERKRGKRRGEAFAYALQHGLLKDGDEVYLMHNLPSWVSFDENNPEFRATVVSRGGKRPHLRWAHDGKEYAASNLARSIFQAKRTDGGQTGGTNGAHVWGPKSGPVTQLRKEHVTFHGGDGAASPAAE